jgi:NAD dependent epimerase/dehydratase family enzyme
MLRLTLGEVAKVLVTGQKVLPRRTEEAGFRFEHPEIEDALRDVLGKKDSRRLERSPA